MSTPRIAALPIGNEWTEGAKAEFQRLLNGLPERVSVDEFPAVFSEGEILRAVDVCRNAGADLMLLAALNGGSARALTLAAHKSGLPTAIWCHNDRHSLASSAIASETLRQTGCRHVLLHGEGARELQSAACAAAAQSVLRSARIGAIGPVHFNLSSVNANFATFLRRFGVWLLPVALSHVRRLFDGVSESEVAHLGVTLKETFAVSASPEALLTASRLYIALRRVVEEHQLNAVAVDCWNDIVPTLGSSPCLGFCFDDFRIACEGDPVLAVTMLAGEAICGSPGYVGDMYSFDEGDGTAVLMHCGGSGCLHDGPDKMEIASQPPPGPVGRSGSVIACRPRLPQGEGTCLILHGEDLDRLHLRECRILETDFSNQMRVFVRIEGETSQFRSELAGNHYVVFPGNSLDAWRIWAEWNGVVVH